MSNENIRFLELDSLSVKSIPLGDRYGPIRLCKKGTRFFTKKYIMEGSAFKLTWVYQFDFNGENFDQIASFQIRGAVQDIIPDEDGIHIELIAKDEFV